MSEDDDRIHSEAAITDGNMLKFTLLNTPPPMLDYTSEVLPVNIPTITPIHTPTNTSSLVTAPTSTIKPKATNTAFPTYNNVSLPTPTAPSVYASTLTAARTFMDRTSIDTIMTTRVYKVVNTSTAVQASGPSSSNANFYLTICVMVLFTFLT